MELERRTYALDRLEVRADADDGFAIRGHAAVFGQLSDDLGGFREQIAPEAFDETLEDADVRALFNHDPNFVLGRNKSGTLRLSTDRQGLAFAVQPPDAQWARDLMSSIRRGDIDQSSFGFRTIEDKWEKRNGEHIRTLKKVALVDVSPVTFPAYPQTDVASRSLANWRDDGTEAEPIENLTKYFDRQRRAELYLR